MRNIIKLFLIFAFLTEPVKAQYYIPQTSILSATSGMYFDDTEDLNKFMFVHNLPQIEPGRVYFSGINYKSNYFPLIWDFPQKFMYSIDFRIPFTRKSELNGYETRLQSYSFDLEISAIESYLKPFTVHGSAGLGAAFTNLSIEQKNGPSSPQIFNGYNLSYNNFKKITANFNIAGGCNYRVRIIENLFYTKNLLFALEVRYSMPLDFTKAYNSNWTNGSNELRQLPDYHAPALSIELKIGMETQKKAE